MSASAQMDFTLRPARAKPRTHVYFDTTRLPFGDLVRAIRRAEYQDQAVLAAFRAHLVLTPSRAHDIVQAAGVPMLLTSVRRSIATLTKANILRKTGQLTPGPFGAPEHLWEMVPAKSPEMPA